VSESLVVSLTVALIAAAVAVLGYVVNQQWKRRDRKAEVYAQALKAVRTYEELPFRIVRRKDADAETRERYGGLVSDSFIELGFYRAWLLIDSREVGDAYSILLNRTHSECRPNRQAAWATPVVKEDAEAHLGGKFVFNNKPEWSLCVGAMRRELSFWAPFKKLKTRREISKLIKARHLDLNIDLDLTARLRNAARAQRIDTPGAER
jgi:hypothetical protein